MHFIISVLPAMLFLSKKIDLKIPENIQMAQGALIAGKRFDPYDYSIV
jgi:hypothetical protein